MCRAHSSAVIILLSSRGDSPWALPSLLSARLRVLDAVKPGQAVSTCTPRYNISVRNTSRNPLSANLDAEYPIRPGNPRKPATEEIPTIDPLFLMISGRHACVA